MATEEPLGFAGDPFVPRARLPTFPHLLNCLIFSFLKNLTDPNFLLCSTGIPPQARISQVSIPVTISDHLCLPHPWPNKSVPHEASKNTYLTFYFPLVTWITKPRDILLLISSNQHFSDYHPQLSVDWFLNIYLIYFWEIWSLVPYSTRFISQLNKYFLNKTVLIRQGAIAHINIGLIRFSISFRFPFNKIFFYNSVHFFFLHIHLCL